MLRHPRRWALLDDLLMTALQRTLTLAQVHQIPVMIARDLDLDVPRLFDHFLDVYLAVLKRALRFTGCVSNSGFQLALGIHSPHALAAAARGCFQQHRIADLTR